MTSTAQETIEVESGPIMDSSVALSAVDRASIDVQIATAKQYPRSISKALNEAMALATMDEETAASMFYALPRSGKTIEGPSARLAEIMSYTWGNLRVDADIVAEDKETVTAMGTCFDLEKNVAVRVRVKRRITDKFNKRYNADMIGVTSNAAISIALRNCVFKVVPRAFVDRIYLAARKASLGEAGTFTAKRAKALDWFAKAGIKPEQVFAQLGVRGVEDILEDQLIVLRGLVTAIKDGETTIEQTFRPHDASNGASALNEALKTASPATGEGGKEATRPATADAGTLPSSAPLAADPVASGPAPVVQTDEEIRAEEQAMLAREKKKGGR